jgi:hypothetical protein
MRGLTFAFCGALLGGFSAAGLGLLFGSGIQETLAFEIGIYVFVGVALGCALGALAHTITKGSGRMDSIATPREPQPVNKPAAAAGIIVAGLVTNGLLVMRFMNAPPGREGYFIGSLIGGLVGTAFGVYLVMRRK